MLAQPVGVAQSCSSPLFGTSSSESAFGFSTAACTLGAAQAAEGSALSAAGSGCPLFSRKSFRRSLTAWTLLDEVEAEADCSKDLLVARHSVPVNLSTKIKKTQVA